MEVHEDSKIYTRYTFLHFFGMLIVRNINCLYYFCLRNNVELELNVRDLDYFKDLCFCCWYSFVFFLCVYLKSATCRRFLSIGNINSSSFSIVSSQIYQPNYYVIKNHYEVLKHKYVWCHELGYQASLLYLGSIDHSTKHDASLKYFWYRDARTCLTPQLSWHWR